MNSVPCHLDVERDDQLVFPSVLPVVSGQSQEQQSTEAVRLWAEVVAVAVVVATPAAGERLVPSVSVTLLAPSS